MNLARVLEEGIGKLILNKLFKGEIELGNALEQMLELKFADLDLQVEKNHIKEFHLNFELNNKKYYLIVCCNVLIDKKLVPYTCLVFEKNEKDGW